MQSFTDAIGQPWDVIIDVAAVKRVRQLADFDLLDVADGKLFARLADEPVTLVDVAYAIVKPTADERKITDEQFGRAMRGDAIERAFRAIVAETIDFFPNARKREGLTKVMSRSQELADAMAVRANQTLDRLKVTDLMLPPPGDSSGSSPAKSEPTPAP